MPAIAIAQRNAEGLFLDFMEMTSFFVTLYSSGVGQVCDLSFSSKRVFQTGYKPVLQLHRPLDKVLLFVFLIGSYLKVVVKDFGDLGVTE